MSKYVIIPWINNPGMTQDCVVSWLHNADVKILLIGNNLSSADKWRMAEWYKRLSVVESNRIFFWDHNPSLPSLGATWNFALSFVWDHGADIALCANNDIEVRADMFNILEEVLRAEDALFVSGVGVNQETWENGNPNLKSRGGPDFSCYLITKECNMRYPFDENFSPAYCEDLDLHRRIMLGGEGHRIFGIDKPFLHIASGSLKSMSEEKRARIEKQIAEGSRRYYEQKWGGPVNEERYLKPFGPAPQGIDFCTATQVMHKHKCRGWHAPKE